MCVIILPVNIGSIGIRSITAIMSKSRPTKVPVMKKNQPYGDWRKELQVWEATNIALDVQKKVQAGKLFESLEGLPGVSSFILAVNNFKNSSYIEPTTINRFAAIQL